MDYEQKYNEALERAKEYKKHGYMMINAALDNIFPELAESEDERIRKEIISALKFANHKGVYDKHITWLEKQGKDETTHMINPKFKVGDWIVSNTSNLVYRVDSILFPQSKCYYLSHNGGIVMVSFNDEQNYHLWTIQDAKPGDVLATKNAVFIFKNMDKAGLSLCSSYCEVIGNSELGFGFDFSINSIYPATKEQRELLFSKMKDMGYEWDAEKKRFI